MELLRIGMDINIRTSRGTALHEAALCGKVEVVKTLLEHGINTNLRDSTDRTVLDIMAELQTARTREIAKIILSHGGGSSAELASPYENLGEPDQDAGDLSGDPDSPVTCRPRAPGWHARNARSVEELDKRISSFSTTSGCSDCTTSTLQGAKSYESSFMSESEVTMTGTLTRAGDDTSISSASSSASLSPEAAESSVSGPRPASRVSQSTLTASKPPSSSASEKPKIPAKPAIAVKPAHIRPGLKPVQIPNVDDKLGLKPRKPPRRNHSISPVRAHGWESEGHDDSSSCSKKPKAQKSVYSSKSGSKSFDELDDILSEKPRKQLSKKRGRRTLSTISGSDLQRAKVSESDCEFKMLKIYLNQERRDAEAEDYPDPRHSCDSSLSLSSSRDQLRDHEDDCQRCVLDTISNRTLTEVTIIHVFHQGSQFSAQESSSHAAARERYISQKQYKRKIRRESAGSGQPGYVEF